MPPSPSRKKGNPRAPVLARKWTRRAEVRPGEILEAALAEFTERGFDAARMEDVAKRAGISKAGVYLYFESKEALLKALIESRVAPLLQGAFTAAAPMMASPKAAMRLIATGIVTRLADPQNFAVPRLVIAVAARFPEIADYFAIHSFPSSPRIR